VTRRTEIDERRAAKTIAIMIVSIVKTIHPIETLP
jgi:hypothetical protein